MYKLEDLHLRLTTDCNLQCLHCYAIKWSNSNYKLDYYLVKKVILEAIELGCQRITFSGGEPFTYPKIYDLLQFALGIGLEVNAETNGTLIDFDKLEEIEKGELLKIKVSYDGEIMRGNSAQTIRDNIWNLKKSGFNVSIQTVLTKINVAEIDEILLFSKNLGIENRLFMGHSKSGNGINISNFRIEEVLSIKERIVNQYSHVKIELPEYISGEHQKGCGWGISRCEIMPNGDVTSCAPLTYARRDFIAGNIREHTLSELWNSQHFKMIREFKQEQYKGICSTCRFFHRCRGSCRSVSVSLGRELLASYPYCEQYSKLLE